MLKQKEKSIPINKKILNKYESYKDIFFNEDSNNVILIPNHIKELYNISISKLNVNDLRKLARKIFHKYHNTNIFINNGNSIIVTNNGINESIQKVYYNSEQNKYLLEHLKIYSKLGIIIENAILVNQVYELKNRDKYKYWNYYICKVKINKIVYLIELEIVSLNNNKNNYRVHRLNIK